MLMTTHSPLSNQLVAALARDDFIRLEPEFKQVSLTQGDIVYQPGVNQDFVIFPTTCIVVLMSLMQNGSSAETAIIGFEGIVGISVFLGGGSTTSQALVQKDGIGYRVQADIIRKETRLGGPLQLLALRYTQALITQMAQTAVCNRHHAVEQRLCRWLLLSIDRSASDELPVTQETIASILGVRRESVTEAAMKLQEARIIQYSRGMIHILDRRKLEASVCECYAVVQREYARLLPPTAKRAGNGDLP